MDVEPTYGFDEEDSEPITRECAKQGHDEHGSRGLEHLTEGVDLGGFLGKTHDGENVLLGEVLAVEGYV